MQTGVLVGKYRESILRKGGDNLLNIFAVYIQNRDLKVDEKCFVIVESEGYYQCCNLCFQALQKILLLHSSWTDARPRRPKIINYILILWNRLRCESLLDTYSNAIAEVCAGD